MTIPADVLENLPRARGETDIRELLKEKGIDVDKIERKVRASSLNLNKDRGPQNPDNNNLA